MSDRKKSNNKSFIRWGILIIVLLFINYYHLPYYFTIPGDAKVLTEVIEVEDAYDYEGTFMLTTVRMGKANVVNYVWSMFSDQREIIPEHHIRPEGETDEEYQERQMMAMADSQDWAIYVAYNHAGKTAYFENGGVFFNSIISGMDAEKKLIVGDRIIEVNGEEIIGPQKLLNMVSQYSIGESVPLTIERDGNIEELEVEIQPFPSELGQDGGGMGISTLYSDPEINLIYEPRVDIDTAKIGGPSAGLMFSLEIFNQLHEVDITRGYHIAGTGTVDEEGTVGRIGGVNQKVIASHNAGADYFLAPNEGGADDSNYQLAVETANSIGTDMEIVPIDTFVEALEFLNQLPLKKE
ncbi:MULTISPECIES: PDZ domain-containing protein [Bacillaceae]|uniref:endopeptidase La n=1 Tax=Evansella alkalicola TaxID=745819 RepID=A0ABS6JT84_9BACI|nr:MULTISPECIES: PDZ domain-containing protein [Bacillaceae]MBU9720462.1 PDZ domain-containing protein [Bacillus alkalicola]